MTSFGTPTLPGRQLPVTVLEVEVKRTTALIEADASDIASLAARAAALNDLGRQDEAALDLDQAITLSPDEPNLRFNLGLVLQDLDQHDLAIEHLSEALRVEPTDVDTLLARSVSYARLGQHELALADAERALEQKPNNPDAHNARGAALRGLGQLADAVKAYNRAIRERPAHVPAYFNRGLAYRYLGEAGRAESDFATVIDLDPSNEAARTLLEGFREAREKRMAAERDAELARRTKRKRTVAI